ncbi:DUF3825 domain-containing protein [Nostoc sp. CHAB 5834]|nr:DUF3825 domain-containing protein [Nostoc sp. CHAB 5834]
MRRQESELFKFAYCGSNLDQKLQDLANLAEGEEWGYEKERYRAGSSDKLPILHSYIIYTFERIQQNQSEKIKIKDSYACFNTGLLSRHYLEPIYALFRSNPNKLKDANLQDWMLLRFCPQSDKDLIRFAGSFPPRVTYYDYPMELWFNPKLQLTIDYDHIIRERGDFYDNKNNYRFPETYKDLSISEKRGLLEGGVRLLQVRLETSYRIPIPQFYFPRQKIQFLLPIYFGNADNAAMALAAEFHGDSYYSSTCLDLDMAYNNARLLAAPDRALWLKP